MGMLMAAPVPTLAQVDQDTDSEAQEEKAEADGPSAESKSKEVRPALARRKRAALNQFDPKVFEARGRELQGEYYEIASFAKAPAWSTTPAEMATTAPETSSSKNWIIWSGAAGIAVIVGGATGWLMLDKHTESPPNPVFLDDKP